MQRAHATQDFPQTAEKVFGHLVEHENLGAVFGAKVTRLNDGTDGSRNGVGSARRMRVGPLPAFVETNVEVVPNELIRYRITQGGVLRNHEGVVRFAGRDGGSTVDWTITFDPKIPGTGALIERKLTGDLSRALRKLAASGSF